ncbi:hypothetical protein ABIE67_000241 [Streptomyces sp. V4I8]
MVDGTLIPIDRIKADQPYYSMKHRKHGMNVQVIAGAGRHTLVVFARDTRAHP